MDCTYKKILSCVPFIFNRDPILKKPFCGSRCSIIKIFSSTTKANESIKWCIRIFLSNPTIIFYYEPGCLKKINALPEDFQNIRSVRMSSQRVPKSSNRFNLITYFVYKVRSVTHHDLIHRNLNNIWVNTSNARSINFLQNYNESNQYAAIGKAVKSQKSKIPHHSPNRICSPNMHRSASCEIALEFKMPHTLSVSDSNSRHDSVDYKANNTAIISQEYNLNIV